MNSKRNVLVVDYNPLRMLLQSNNPNGKGNESEKRKRRISTRLMHRLLFFVFFQQEFLPPFAVNRRLCCSRFWGQQPCHSCRFFGGMQTFKNAFIVNYAYHLVLFEWTEMVKCLQRKTSSCQAKGAQESWAARGASTHGVSYRGGCSALPFKKDSSHLEGLLMLESSSLSDSPDGWEWSLRAERVRSAATLIEKLTNAWLFVRFTFPFLIDAEWSVASRPRFTKLRSTISQTRIINGGKSWCPSTLSPPSLVKHVLSFCSVSTLFPEQR